MFSSSSSTSSSSKIFNFSYYCANLGCDRSDWFVRLGVPNSDRLVAGRCKAFIFLGMNWILFLPENRRPDIRLQTCSTVVGSIGEFFLQFFHKYI